MSENSKIHKYLEVIERSLNLIREELGKGCVCNQVEDHVLSWICNIHGEVSRSGTDRAVQAVQNIRPSTKPIYKTESDPLVVEQPKIVQSPPTIDPEARRKHIEELMSIDCWPEALSSPNICKTDDLQTKRAKAILDMLIDLDTTKIKFLDFGCGGGWTTQQMALRGTELCVGYDIVESENWENKDGLKFTTDFDEVKKQEYDIILLFDVLDHCHDPVEIMKSLKPLLKSDGPIYVRCHPFFAKHGTHLYEAGLNKAFIHLFLKPEELAELGYEPPFFTRFEDNPLEAYRWWFNDYKIVKEKPRTDKIHEFFLTPAFKELLAEENKLDNKEFNLFLDNMQINFVDYTLVHNDKDSG